MGRVERITLVLDATGATRTVNSVDAEAGRGLEGDYHDDLTLIAAEALDGLREDTGIELTGEQSRRNLLTRGIDLNALVGKTFRVGPIECVGVELCEPCAHLTSLTHPQVLRGMVHRAGLNADILTDGEIAIGDPVVAQ
ncbi:MAG: MOSC domain-containing protein [Solirubrobacterales bacterium]